MKTVYSCGCVHYFFDDVEHARAFADTLKMRGRAGVWLCGTHVTVFRTVSMGEEGNQE